MKTMQTSYNDGDDFGNDVVVDATDIWFCNWPFGQFFMFAISFARTHSIPQFGVCMRVCVCVSVCARRTSNVYYVG